MRIFLTAFLMGIDIWAQVAQPDEIEARKIDYTDGANWLCRPGRQDACAANLDATAIAADGTMTKETFHADANAAVDCFYVYPTVSTEPGFNASMTIGLEERRVVVQQFARFGSACRLYAPMYRQVTLAGLRKVLSMQPLDGDPQLGYRDVVDAWNEYLAHDNKGRGVVLIGHSQGSSVLTPLIAKDIDGKPVQAKLVSAILMGTSLQVPRGRVVGGSFKSIPLCQAVTQTGCVITFSSYRASPPPPPNARFGQAHGATVAGCVNPAAVEGGSGELKSYFPARNAPIAGDSGGTSEWTNPPRRIETPFVTTPGLLTAECVSTERLNYLAITVHPTPDGVRANDIRGDLAIGGVLMKGWGLHLVDANLTMGNLVEIVKQQAKAFTAK